MRALIYQNYAMLLRPLLPFIKTKHLIFAPQSVLTVPGLSMSVMMLLMTMTMLLMLLGCNVVR
jgi:hypothetical protein